MKIRRAIGNGQMNTVTTKTGQITENGICLITAKTMAGTRTMQSLIMKGARIGFRMTGHGMTHLSEITRTCSFASGNLML